MAIGCTQAFAALNLLLATMKKDIMPDQTESKNLNGALFKQMQDMHQAWLERLARVRDIESDYGTRLLHAKSPTEATAICTEWMEKRIESIVRDQQAFTNAWIRLITDSARSTAQNGAGRSDETVD